MGCQASGSIYNMAQQITYTNTHNNNKWYITHKTMQLLLQFTETEHKTTHRINWITTQNEYNHNYINKKISIAIH
jgi:hypothetical protein